MSFVYKNQMTDLLYDVVIKKNLCPDSCKTGERSENYKNIKGCLAGKGGKMKNRVIALLLSAAMLPGNCVLVKRKKCRKSQ